jgi:hypothetical protein
MIDTSIDVIAKGAVEHAKDVAQDTVEQLTAKAQRRRRRRRSGRRPNVWVLLGVLGIVGLAAFVWRRRASSRTAEPAPDAFGAAVRQERAAQAGMREVATPGA